MQQRDHPVDLRGARLTADRVLAHRRQSKRRMSNQEAGIDGDAVIEPLQPIAE